MTENVAHRLNARKQAPLLHAVGQEAQDLGLEAWVVGGLVRDLLLGATTADVDFVTVGPGSGIRLARAVAKRLGAQSVYEYANFGTAAVRVRRAGFESVLEFVAARRESYRQSSRKPRVAASSLEEDLARRDFTINAMAVSVLPNRFGALLDPFDGRKHLDERRIITPRPPGQTFKDDPLRMLRAARFAVELNFTVDPTLYAAMRHNAHRLEIVSQERITDELEKIVASDAPSFGLRLLEETNLLRRILPELSALKGVETIRGQRHKDNFYHTLGVLDNVVQTTWDEVPLTGYGNDEKDSWYWLRWAALLHDIGKPRSKRFETGSGWTFHGHEDRGARMVPAIFRRLRLPLGARMAYVQKLVALHHRPVALVDETVTDSAVRRLLYDAGEDIDDLMILVRADITSRNPARVRRYLQAFDRVEEKFAEIEEKDRLRNFQLPIDGEEIMEMLDISEGVAVGIIKDAIKLAILEGDIPNEREAAEEVVWAVKDGAIFRDRLFRAMVLTLRGPERRASQALKDAILHGELPNDYDAALARLKSIKARALREAVGS